MNFTVSSAHHGDHRGLYRQQRTPWSSSRVKPSAAHTHWSSSWVIPSAAHTLVIIADFTVSSAHIGHHRGSYRQQRTPWSSSRVLPSAVQTIVVIVMLSVSTVNNGRHLRYRRLYRQQRTPWSSSRVIQSEANNIFVIAAYTVRSAHHFDIAGYTKAPLTMNIIAGYDVSCANHGRYRRGK
ncbi:hypothetical protein DPMN_145900 [Dreissena polymorpha]|uniref:Uncharacterized protein n=1 Tax=Dreissena polymorpha TaxID=45954 RepID=A0A9D4F6X3_DREPO|nr:hypothetical protein DPMN_145900 [Dreissena polymorpha]